MANESKYRKGELVRIVTTDPEQTFSAVILEVKFFNGNPVYTVECDGVKYSRFSSAIWLDYPYALIEELVNL